MKIFVNRKIKRLFCGILLSIFCFTLISALLLVVEAPNAAAYVLAGSLCMSGVILALCLRYFRQQHVLMEQAIAQIREYLSGNRDITIECNDEGELYRLFHEVNSLVSILNAHAENEKSTRLFLKRTISDISHQLKTPLAALNIYNGILQDEAGEHPTIARFCALSEKELDRVETLVQNLLKITRFDAGAIVLEKAPEKVSGLAGRVRDSFLFRAGQEGKQIVLSGSEEVTFFCDRSWMMEAMGNLVKNALDHTEKGDFIRIEWQAFASIVQITVRDSGGGIRPEDMPHIFKRFYRSRFSGDTQGLGLGLSLTKAIVEAHRGTIEADSHPGGGTSFTMNFLT